jgi:ribonuclease E
MSNLLTHLAARSLGAKEQGVPALRPRLPSLYEPGADKNPDRTERLAVEVEAEAPEADSRPARPEGARRPSFEPRPPATQDPSLSAPNAAAAPAARSPRPMRETVVRERPEEPSARRAPPQNSAPPAGVLAPAAMIQPPPSQGAAEKARTGALGRDEPPTTLRPVVPAAEAAAARPSAALAAPKIAAPQVLAPPIRVEAATPGGRNETDRAPKPSAPPVVPAPPRASLRREQRLAPEPSAPQRVQVTIGRIEIRAAAASPPPMAPVRPKPAMSLDDYLAQRERS